MTQLTIVQLADHARGANSAIRLDEERGLVQSRRTTGNQRRYEQSQLRRIAFIRTAQRVGLTLEEIAEALDTLPAGRTPTKADWTRLSRTWRPRLDDQIRRIELLRDQLDSCIGCGCLSLKTCALRNPGDVAAAAGPGPVYLQP